MTWDSTATDLNDPELVASGAYVGPEKVGERVTLSRIKFLMNNTEAMKEYMPAFDWDNTTGTNDSVMNKGDEFVMGAMSERANQPSSAGKEDLKKGKGKGKKAVAMSSKSAAMFSCSHDSFDNDTPVVTKKASAKKRGAKLPEDPMERERMAGENFATAYHSRPNEIKEIFSHKFHGVVSDVMCEMRKIAHNSAAPWFNADFNTEDDTANDAIYLMIAKAIVNGHLRYFDIDENNKLEVGVGILVLCADIKTENEMREFLIHNRDREAKKAADKKRVKEEKQKADNKRKNGDYDDDDDWNGGGATEDVPSSSTSVKEPPRKKFAGMDFEEVDASDDDEKVKEIRKKFVSFSDALNDRVMRYDMIMPGIAKSFCKVPYLPENLLIITRGFFSHKTVPATCDKTMNIGNIMSIQNSPKLPPGTHAIFDDLNGKAAILAPEGEVVAVSIAYALAQENVTKDILKKYLYLPKGLVIPETPLIVVTTVDGDIMPVTTIGQCLNPATDNVFMIHAGAGATMKAIVNVKRFKDHLDEKYGSAEAYIAMLCVYGGDYVCGINRVTPTVLKNNYFDYAMKDTENFLKDTCEFFMKKVSDDQTYTLFIKWMENNPRSLVFLDESDEHYSLKLNHLFMIGLFIIANIKKASKGAKFGFFCPCNRGVEGYCEPSVSEDVNLHNLLVSSLTVETYLNYLRQQIDLNVKIQVPICSTEKYPITTGFYRAKNRTIMWGIHPPYEYDTPSGYLLFGELADIERYEQALAEAEAAAAAAAAVEHLAMENSSDDDAYMHVANDLDIDFPVSYEDEDREVE